jgi:hypothetical protein
MWMPCWRSGFPHEPIAPSTGCAWDRPVACASKVEDGAWGAWRTSARIPACALCSSSPQQGTPGICVSQDDRIPARIDWEDPVVAYGLHHRVKYARLIVRQASSTRAEGADRAGQRYFVQLALEGIPSHKPKHAVGSDILGLDLGPSTLAIVPRAGTPRARGASRPSWLPLPRPSAGSSAR